MDYVAASCRPTNMTQFCLDNLGCRATVIHSDVSCIRRERCFMAPVHFLERATLLPTKRQLLPTSLHAVNMFDWSEIQSLDKGADQSLQSVFEMCARAHANLDKLPSNPDEAQDVLNCVTDLACYCAGRVEALGLFSVNEDADDLSTVSLRCIVRILRNC